ncbi:MAG: deaminase [Candidatus Sungiibacteriota bacterium]
MIKYSIIAYIPALHRGYIDFFRKYSGGTLFVLDEELVREVPRMERDIRALKAEEVKALLEGLNMFDRIVVLNKQTLSDLQNEVLPIVLPDEDVSRAFAEAYLIGKKLEFVSVFLRWDKQISTKEFEVPPDRVISHDEADREMMGAASAEAAKSPDWWRQIGAVAVRDGKILLVAYNRPVPSKDYTLGPFGDPRSNFDAGEHFELAKTIHAEAATISEAARRGIPLAGASLYITTFPCPVCAKSIAAAGIKRVYYSKGYSLLDAEDVLKAAGVEIVMVE